MRHTLQLKALLLLGLFLGNAVADDKKDASDNAANSNKTVPTVSAPKAANTATTNASQAVMSPQNTPSNPPAKNSVAAVSLPAGAPLSSATCIPCHAADGNTDNPAFPKLAGLSASYIIKELQEFKKGANGHRNNAIMLTIANQLSTQDMDELAQYYAKQTRTIGEASANNIELGRRIYRSGNRKTGVPACAACHAPNGEGNELAGFPRLAGQNAQYVTEQLQAFRSGDRTNDLNAMMQGVATHLSDEEIEAVSNYVSGLH
jgi:cytochrome c553